MTVRRTLPQRQRSLIGAWCFVDHYGPDEVARLRRHGRRAAPAHRAADRELAVRRRDRAPRQRRAPRDGASRRGEPDDRPAAASATPRSRRRGDHVLHGAQLWVALPDAAPPHRARLRAPRTRPPCAGDGWHGHASSSARCSATPRRSRRSRPLLGAEIAARRRHRRSRSTSTPAFEHGVLVDTGGVVGRRRRPSRAELGLPRRPARTRLTPRQRTSTSRPGCCCSAVRRSARRSSCGGTSSAAPTRRSSLRARSGWPTPSGSAGWRGCRCRPAPRRRPDPAVRIRPRQNPPPPVQPTA